MNHSAISIKYRGPDLVANLFAQRMKILAWIIENTNVTSTKPTNKSLNHHLQQEYNHMTDQITQLEYHPFRDPMKVLPLELCADIIEEAIRRYDRVDRLLDLTSVSRRWCNILTSLPTLWTEIVFDSSKGDYLAKAAIGLSLSGTCELSVTIAVPFELWQEISSIVLAESGRIASLQIESPPNYSDSEKILHDFEGLPVLKTLELPPEHNSGNVDSRPRNIGFEKMPLLSTISGPRPGPLEYSCSRFIRNRIIHIPTITQDMVNVWARLPNLIGLFLDEHHTSPDYSPKSFKSSLPSVRHLVYSGRALERALSLLGPNVTSITVDVYESHQVLDLLRRFPRIHHLKLLVSTHFNYEGVAIGTTPISCGSVESL